MKIDEIIITDPLGERSKKLYVADLNEIAWIIEFLSEKQFDERIPYHAISLYLRGRGLSQSKNRLIVGCEIALHLLNISHHGPIKFPQVEKLLRLSLYIGKNIVENEGR